MTHHEKESKGWATQPTRRWFSRDNIIIVFAAVLALAVSESMDQRGMPQKWHAAIVGSLIPFAVVIMSYRRWWARWFFWASLATCFVIHVVAIWAFFQYALANIQTLGIATWFPVAFVETFVLLVAVKKVAEKITGKHESVKLT